MEYPYRVESMSTNKVTLAKKLDAALLHAHLEMWKESEGIRICDKEGIIGIYYPFFEDGINVSEFHWKIKRNNKRRANHYGV